MAEETFAKRGEREFKDFLKLWQRSRILSILLFLIFIAPYIYSAYQFFLKRDLEKEIATLKGEKLELETELIPFRTVGVEKFTGSEKEAIQKLGNYIAELEKKDIEYVSQINSLEEKIDQLSTRDIFRPLIPEKRIVLVNALKDLRIKSNGIKLKVVINVESGNNSRMLFRDELLKILDEAGIEARKGDVNTTLSMSAIHAIVLSINTASSDVTNEFLKMLSAILHIGRIPAYGNDKLAPGEIIIFLNGNLQFNPDGSATIH
jgi:hypothetical protein